MNFPIRQCEDVLGYTFKNKELLVNCFTHSSYTNEHKEFKSNERLEFLGDAILGFVISKQLFMNYNNEDEGVLTFKKQAIVSKFPLAETILSQNLDRFLILGEGQKKQFNSNKTSICENLFEAIVAGIYLDGGLICAETFIMDMFNRSKAYLDFSDVNTDYKSQLLHYVQNKKLGCINYVEVSKTGPSHNPTFTMCVKIGDKIIAEGTGASHKIAEQQSAKKALGILQSEEINFEL